MSYRTFASIAIFTFFLVESTNAQLVRFRLEATDMEGNAISSVNVGEDFLLNSYAKDLRTEAQCAQDCGVFAGYLDVTFDSQLASVGGSVTYSDDYQNGPSADFTTPGLMDDIGAFSTSVNPIGLDERHLFAVPMKAMSLGSLSLESGPANSPPQHHVLLFGIDTPINDIEFGAANVQIVPEPKSSLLLLLGLVFVVSRKRPRLG